MAASVIAENDSGRKKESSSFETPPKTVVATPNFRLATGDKLPGLSVTGVSGKKYTSEGLRGRIVVFEWTNFECPCVQSHYQVGLLSKLQEKYVGQGILWLTVVSSAPGKAGYVSGNSLEKLRAVIGNTTSDVLLDPDGKLARELGAVSTPYALVFGKESTLLYQGAIDSARSYEPEDLRKAINYVEKTVEAYRAGRPVSPAATPPFGCAIKFAK